ncbi:MAG: ADP-ribosylglycohydrolase family protein [Verrucomicrobia bacterium]|nr:ADP-ribosylglycohydrolase family protein [Verrucomicrobiota bacterium]
MIGQFERTVIFQKAADHQARARRALLSLEGLAIADAVGEMLSYRYAAAPRIIREGLVGGPWFRTDDSEMAISIVEILKLYGHIHQDALARRFAWRFERDQDRGYGKMTRMQLREIIAGAAWRPTAAAAFGGQGSMGNGGAMRVAPVGAYFADDLEKVAAEAELSALVTHTHPEGVAGTIAVAIAAATAWNVSTAPTDERARSFFETVLRFTPESQVRRGLVLASGTPTTVPVEAVAKALGNGFLITAPDTVPFALWCAAHNLDNYVEAISTTISGGGDCDTNAAIVGGIVALSAGPDSIPDDWRKSRERLPFWELVV